ncbi:MAG: sigma-54-dependent transcriptional regulator [Thermodesulfobacteriota bacterium]
MEQRTRVLVAEDDGPVRASIVEFLEEDGFTVTQASTGEEALEEIKRENFDLVVTDLKMPGADGLEVLRAIQRDIPQTLGILITGFGTIQSAVQAMKLGAFEYLQKPINFDEFRMVLERALEYQRLHRENKHYRQELRRQFGFENIIGHSEAMQRTFDLVRRVADSDSTVIIYGESGTGKELIAKAIHYQSGRSEKPFVPINCAAIPADLLESELFGYEKGAFTGAHRTKIGRFEYADGGTLFLDEIGEMSPQLQVKLLRALQERSFERLGGVKPVQVDVRIISATNQDLEKAVSDGRFREDLFYRLSVIPIHIPPLRHRREDIPLLVEHFLERFNKGKNREVSGLSREAMDRLIQYAWPGNVRELENLMERLVVLKRCGTIELEDLPEKMSSRSRLALPTNVVLPEEGIHLDSAVESFERELILQALRRTKGVKKDAAKLLRMKRTTLIQKMKRKRIVPLEGHTPKPSESIL